MKKRYLVIQGYLGDFFVLLIQAFSIYLFVNNNPNYLYASWVLVLALVNPVVGFSSMSIDSLISTEISNSKIKEFLSFRFTNILIFLPIILFINYFYESNASPWFLLLIAFSLKSFEGFSTAFRAIYYRDNSIYLASVSKVIAKTGYLLGFGYFIKITQSLSRAMVIILIWNIASFVIYDMFLQRKYEFLYPFSFSNPKSYKTFAIKYYPLGFNNFLTLLVISLPQIFIEKYLSLEILSLVGIALLFNSATDNIYISSLNTLRRSYADILLEKNQFKTFMKQVTILYTVFLMTFCSIFYLFGDLFFKIYNQNFYEQVNLLILILFGSYFFYLSNAFNFRYFVVRDILQIFKFNLTRTLIAVLFSYYFISKFQILGFGYIYLLSNICYALHTLTKYLELNK
jgi:O-antigen/teichoic acid export membrane protein